MGVDLIPAVLATNPRQLRRRLTIARRCSRTIHLDIMDGQFVRTRSIPVARYRSLFRGFRIELHLMVRSLDPYWDTILTLRPHRVYLHLERKTTLVDDIRRLRLLGIEAGIAINPTTPLHTLTSVRPLVRHLLIMGVHPGRYHAPYITSTVRRIATLHRRWPRLRLACDGGMSTATIPGVIEAGARQVVVGSAVMLGRDPDAAWRRLRQLTS